MYSPFNEVREILKRNRSPKCGRETLLKVSTSLGYRKKDEGPKTPLCLISLRLSRPATSQNPPSGSTRPLLINQSF